MSGDVLKSWAADAQAEIDRLSKPAFTPAIVAAVDALTMAVSFISDLNSAHGNTEGQGVREACGKALAGLVELLPAMENAPSLPLLTADDLRMMAESLVSLAKASPGVEIPVIDGDTPPHKILAAAQAVAVKWGLADRYVSFYTPAGASVLVTAQA